MLAVKIIVIAALVLVAVGAALYSVCDECSGYEDNDDD